MSGTDVDLKNATSWPHIEKLRNLPFHPGAKHHELYKTCHNRVNYCIKQRVLLEYKSTIKKRVTGV
jgi:hypothetical protein